MSDFGTLLIVKSGEQFTDAQKEELQQKVEELIEENTYESILGEPFQAKLVELENRSVGILLSEYWYGGEDDDEDEDSFNFAKEDDVETAEQLVSDLKSSFINYSFTLEFDDW